MPPPFVCPWCPARFGTAAALTAHEAAQDCDLTWAATGPRDRTVRGHACDFCGKAFSSASALVRHIRSHTGERPSAPRSFRRVVVFEHTCARTTRASGRSPAPSAPRARHGFRKVDICKSTYARTRASNRSPAPSAPRAFLMARLCVAICTSTTARRSPFPGARHS